LPAAGGSPGAPVAPSHDLRAVLRLRAFRRLWTALTLSSLGDWLGLLATTALASELSAGSYQAQSFAVAGVFILRLLPAVLLGPFAGVVADRLDRRWTMVVCDCGRFAMFLSIPLVRTLPWLYVASFMIEALSLFWIPAKEATVPNLVPRHRLEAANQLSLVTTYGSAPVAAALFTLLSLVAGVLGSRISYFTTNSVDLALYFDAATFLFSAATIAGLREIPAPRRSQGEAVPSVFRTVVDGWRFVGQNPTMRGLLVGMLGAFAGGGAVIGLARTYVHDLGAGDSGYGVLFGTVFVGLAGGMLGGPRLLADFSRRRLLGLSICGAGLSLGAVALVPNIVIVVFFAACLGAFAGVAWVTGYTMIGLEVDDAIRGRTFAFVQTMVRVTLVVVLAVTPVIAGLIGRHTFAPTKDVALSYNGAAITMLLAGLFALGVGIVSLRVMDDRPGVPLGRDLLAAVRAGRDVHGRSLGGFLLAFEGGDGTGKSTQVERVAGWLRAQGHEVVLTREPGATPLGARIREMLLDPANGQMSARTEVLLYAADRAQHVEQVIRPALHRGAIVVTDRYMDSSVAYQSGGRAVAAGDVVRVSRWATDALRPDATILLDLAPEVAQARASGPVDRLEAEPEEFHARVRRTYLEMAARDPLRYHVVDASASADAVFAVVRHHLEPVLPAPKGGPPPAPQQRAAPVRAERAGPVSGAR